jgi:hypothetical protein
VANSVLNVTATIISANGLLLADGSAARLTGVAKAAVAGVASFDALSLYGLPGIDYTLKFAVTGLGFATSAPIQVLHAAAHHLTITQQPTGGNATGSNLAGQPIVQLRDSFENLVTANSTDVISARLSTASVSRVLRPQRWRKVPARSLASRWLRCLTPTTRLTSRPQFRAPPSPRLPATPLESLTQLQPSWLLFSNHRVARPAWR